MRRYFQWIFVTTILSNVFCLLSWFFHFHLLKMDQPKDICFFCPPRVLWKWVRQRSDARLVNTFSKWFFSANCEILSHIPKISLVERTTWMVQRLYVTFRSSVPQSDPRRARSRPFYLTADQWIFPEISYFTEAWGWQIRRSFWLQLQVTASSMQSLTPSQVWSISLSQIVMLKRYF